MMNGKIVVLLCLAVFQVGSLYGDIYVLWDGEAGDGLWTSGNNWEFNNVPVSGETAWILGNPPNPVLITIDGTDLVVQDLWIARWGPGGAVNMQMTGGDIFIENIFRLSEQVMDASVSTFDMNSGTMTVGDSISPSWSGFELSYKGDSVFNMNAGTVAVYRNIKLKPEAALPGTALLNLNGGTMTADGLTINTGGSINVAGGTMILDGNDTGDVNGFVTDGLIVAYGGLGDVIFSYDDVNNETTITGSGLRPVNPSPANNATDVVIDVGLSWDAPPENPEAVIGYDVYVDNDSDLSDVTPVRVTETSYQPSLGTSRQYFWRVDAVEAGEVVRSGSYVWSFITIFCPSADVTGDCYADMYDIAAIAGDWLQCGFAGGPNAGLCP